MSTSPVANHPLTRCLRSNPALTETTLYSDLPPTIRHSKDRYTLLDADKIASFPLIFWDPSSKSSTMIFHLGPSLSGYPGLVHGGVLATLLDEGFATALFKADPTRVPLTVDLNIRYRKAAPTGEVYALWASVHDADEDAAKVTGWIELLGTDADLAGDLNGERVVVSAEASFKWVRPVGI
ncbi:hypothetical protein ASPCAL03193 [Aspergillus calidoustus]|uniref:Thioesterase domain-containing protein n=1 Tax=Aspergillus calidoustus TaxID=454130 RepID=A0A0U5GPT1_ASPCI|nr:hypothetical protein ASPCAL03193 [Aspergillus calidoustus]